MTLRILKKKNFNLGTIQDALRFEIDDLLEERMHCTLRILHKTLGSDILRF